jgi:hypothetical protein
MDVIYDDLPRVLHAKDIKRFLTIGLQRAYILAHSGESQVLKLNVG